jgi:branched-chain amino acid transport system permease protein
VESLIVQLVIYGLTNGAVLALSAAGFTLTYAVARQINLAHGSTFALCTVIVTSLAAAFGVTEATPMGLRLGVLVVLAGCGAIAGAALSVGVERLAFRPFATLRDPLGPLVASVGLAFILLQAAVWWHSVRFVPVPNAHQGVDLPLLAMPDLIPKAELGWGGVSFTLKDALVLATAALVAALLGLVLARTRVGRLLRGTAEDPEQVSLVGGDTRRAQLLAFALGGAVAGLGAAIFAAYFGGASAQYGVRSGLAAMTAAVLGGVGEPRGALVGGLVIGIVAAFSDYMLDAHWTPVIVLLLLIVLLVVRPSGLGQRGAQEPPRQSVIVAMDRQSGSKWLPGLLLAGVIAFGLLDASAGWQRLPSATMALLLVALALGLTVVVGFAGLLDLGYAAFFAIGSYTAALLTSPGRQLLGDAPGVLHSAWFALLTAGLVAAAFGLLFGIPSIRTRGEYLAIVTLALGEIVPLVIWHLPNLTGGPRGVSGIPSIGGPTGSYLLAAALACGACLAALRLGRSGVGRAWAAVREDELAAAASGVDPPRFKLLAFALGAGCAGLAGAVFAQLFGSVEPSQFDLTVSLMVLAAVVLGSRWGVAGVIVAALAIAVYDRVVVDLLGAFNLRQHNYFVFGMALLLASLSRARSATPLHQLVGQLLGHHHDRPACAARVRGC